MQAPKWEAKMRELPPQVISLIHYVELSQSGWWEETIDRCVMGILWLIKSPAPVGKIRKEIEANLGLDLKTGEINDSLSRLIQKDKVNDLGDGRYRLTLSSDNDLSRQVENSQKLEESVKLKFKQRIETVAPKLDTEKIWGAFIKKLLIPLVTDSGARIYQFLFSKTGKNNQFVNLTEEFIGELPEKYRDKLSKCISEFIDPSDSEITKFIFSYLDAYFVVSSSGLSSKVTNKLSSLRDEPAEFVIYVDTNFIYSVLGLHDNPSNEAAKDLMQLAQSASKSVHIRFVINPITLQETQQSLKTKRITLGNIPFPPNLAEAATRSSVTGLYKTFFQQVAQAGTSLSANDFFVIYENNLIRILQDKGIEVVADEKIDKYATYPDILSDIRDQVYFEETKYKDRAKSEAKITNDVILWHYTKDLRPKGSFLPIDAKYWIVTVDYRLLAFDRYKSEKLLISPICMLPAQLIQVLRFFSPRSVEFEKIMLSTMRFPLIIREYDPKVERVALKIVKQLARFEGIEDLSIDTLQKVITDEGLNTKLTESNLIESTEIGLIRDALARQIAEYQNTINTLKEELTEKDKAHQEIVGALQNSQAKYLEESQELRTKVETLQEMLQRNTEERMAEREERERRKSIRNFVSLCLLMILPYPIFLVVVWYWLNSLIPVQWIVYSIIGLLTIGVSILLISVLIKSGNLDPNIAQNNVFRGIASKLSWKAIVSFVVTVAWLLVFKLLEEFVVKSVFP